LVELHSLPPVTTGQYRTNHGPSAGRLDIFSHARAEGDVLAGLDFDCEQSSPALSLIQVDTINAVAVLVA